MRSQPRAPQAPELARRRVSGTPRHPGTGKRRALTYGDVTRPRQPIAGGPSPGPGGGPRPAGGAVARWAAPRSRHSLPPPATQRLRRRPRAAAMADVEDGEEPCALSSHSGSAGSKSGGDKMFSLKKWNAVAMWSWDVECDTCAICRVQVMGKRCTRGPGRAAASAGPAPGEGGQTEPRRDCTGRSGGGVALPRCPGTAGHARAAAGQRAAAAARGRGVVQQAPSAGDWYSGERNGW